MVRNLLATAMKELRLTLLTCPKRKKWWSPVYQIEKELKKRPFRLWSTDIKRLRRGGFTTCAQSFYDYMFSKQLQELFLIFI